MNIEMSKETLSLILSYLLPCRTIVVVDIGEATITTPSSERILHNPYLSVDFVGCLNRKYRMITPYHLDVRLFKVNSSCGFWAIRRKHDIHGVEEANYINNQHIDLIKPLIMPLVKGTEYEPFIWRD